MPCYHPRSGWYSGTVNPTGKRSVRFDRAPEAGRWGSVTVPCARCIGCRLERSRQWAIRCEHERAMHKEACFITLTYDNEHLPRGGSLQKRDFQTFMKRLRKHVWNTKKQKIRYYMVGEYGEKRGRPHYHAILFGIDFTDREVVATRKEITYFESKTIREIWGNGHTQIGEANFETAAYCARYITKKLTGKRANEYGGKIPEYNCMSRRPGIALDWVEKYMGDVFPCDRVVMRGLEMRPPKYYANKFEILDPTRYEQIKNKRRDAIKQLEQENPRYRVKEKIQNLKFEILKRGYENGET